MDRPVNNVERPGEGRSLGDLFSSLFNNVSTLFRQEVELAKAEIRESLSRAIGDAVGLVIGGVILLFGVMTLVAAAVLGLATVMPGWLAALVVGGALALIGAIVLLVNLRDMREIDVTPERTVKTLRDDARFVKETLT